MDLVYLMYDYINKFINIDELLLRLKNIDLSKYSKTEVKQIEELISDVEKIKIEIHNEIDEVEIKRIASVNKSLAFLEEARSKSDVDEESKEFIETHYAKLLKEKDIVKDGGKLYSSIFDLMTNNSIVNKYAGELEDEDLLNFITRYIHVSFPPKISQEAFNDLVKIGIKLDKREALWRLAFNYNQKGKDLTLIEDYFISKRDDYYLTELISAVQEDLDLKLLAKKVISTKDNNFMVAVASTLKKFGIITEDDIKKIREENNI